MGAHFSSCGRFLAACVACMLPHVEADSGLHMQQDVTGASTSPTRHPISALQVIYELRAIAFMMCAQDVDPKNLEVLLALGMTHTNDFTSLHYIEELEQAAALKYLYGWLQNHPKYGTIAPPEWSNSLYYADVDRLFNESAQISPDDGDDHIVLGVLYNLSREYDKVIGSFQTVLKLKPRNYSL
ncbi:hypothetical protein GIB67_007143 [Kingdonia uniflora]|uniref:Uncharacterized protein n=1 Tax=Kingdonia uniflora TaxID=39325 RepID=A0A7J7MLE5_9MAGN|nr:hypothetical protein GIB67_007143 [Kingdonia uniflora]